MHRFVYVPIWLTKEAIGITCNYVNTNTAEERKLEEFGTSYVYNQAFFKKIQESGIKLENLVYYRDETHYFVTTAKKENLLEWGVLKANDPDLDVLMSPENIDQRKLEEYTQTVVDHTGYVFIIE